MEIPEIKQKLSIHTVLQHYHLEPDKHGHICCPFHDDKTPSMQIYPNTNTFHCFGCGKTGDTIEFIQQKQGISKHEAILKAQELIGVPVLSNTNPKPAVITKEGPQTPEERVSIWHVNSDIKNKNNIPACIM
jgi:DNA primase